MRLEALKAGKYESAFWKKNYARAQILTINDLLDGAGVDMPQQHGTFRQAERHKRTSISEEDESQQDLI